MKAAVFYDAEDLRLEDVPEPEAGPDEVVVKVLACGFCGSDIEYYYGRSPLGTADGKGPLVLGHEICGRVVQAGKLAEQYGLQEGDRVALNPVQSCNACNACRSGGLQFCQNLTVLGVTMNGGFAEYAKTKIAHAYKLPDSLTDEQGAFVEMLSSAVYAVQRAEVEPGNFAVVYGPGPVGLAFVQLLKNEGARVGVVGTRTIASRSRRQWAPNTSGTCGRPARRTTCRTSRPRSRMRTAARSPTACWSEPPPSTRTSRPSRSPATARRSSSWASPGPEDSIRVPTALEPLPGQDDPLLDPLPTPVAADDRAARERCGGHLEDHHALGDPRGHRAAIERVLNREDHVVKTVIKPGG